MDGNVEYIRIEGTVLSVIYQNSENGYAVLRLTTDGDTITVVGCLPEAAAGENLYMEGTWVSHQSYGQQFKAEYIERRLPSGRRAIYSYLAFGAVKGIGPSLAKLIVEKFGDETLDIIESQPERLAEIKGISPRKAQLIGAEFQRRSGMRKLMEFLAQHGIRPELAIKLYKCYGDEAMEAVRDNPYILTHDMFGADFFEADTLALSLGFEGDSPQRVEAAVLFELRHNLNNGHTFLPRNKLIAATNQLIDVPNESVEEALEILMESGYVISQEIAGQNACYLDELYSAETYTAMRIELMASYKIPIKNNIEKIISRIEKEQGIKYAENQKRAVTLAAKNQILVLTGGPGTGKTTSIKGILAMFDMLGLDTAFAAPTGRAAKRMSELADREAFTIHRLLEAGYVPESDEIVFSKNERDQLKADAIILDETSMVDITLMSSLLKAMKPMCRLVLVGDADQLPSVGSGNVFSDIIRSGIVETVRLDEIFRQAKESAIIKNAHKINHGEIPDWGENRGDFFFLKRGSREKTVDTITELCTKRLPDKMGIPPHQIQVLSPVRQGETGTINLNRRLQQAVNPPAEGKKEKIYGEFTFREGDRVMQIRNNYDIIWKSADGLHAGTGMFNGDIGSILKIDREYETVSVDFDGKIAEYPFEMLYELEPAYAMTVHKAQGSEYRAVILAAMPGASALMTRGVLYTAVTRAKELLIIVGDSDVASKMTLDDRKQRRYSGLRYRLAEKI